MRITHFTPGTGTFLCGSCLRDHALVKALRRRGHDVTMMPLYLPLVLEGDDPLPDDRVFMGGLNTYLQQKLGVFRFLPAPVARRLDSPRLLRWLASKGDMTSARGLGPMTLSMLRGETGRQATELERLIDWMAGEPTPDVVCLSNVMLIGLARRLKTALDATVVCTLQGEQPYLDALPEPYRSEAWAVIKERAVDVDAFTPVSSHYGALMQERLGIDEGRLHVVHCGIDVDDVDTPVLQDPTPDPMPPTIGYVARLCADKGLGTLVDAFIKLKHDGAIDGLRLRAAGAMLKPDAAYVDGLRARLAKAGCDDDAEFHGNVPRADKQALLASLSVLSVPATCGESFGLYILEALAAGVPVVQPRHGAFPEVLDATGGGILCEPDDPASLADGIRRLLLDGDEARALGERGRQRVHESFTSNAMALAFENVCMMAASCRTNSR